MVDRLENKAAQKALTVVDLDGTYVGCNTLREYILSGLRHHLRARHLRSSLTVSLMMALRLLRLISHRTMKFACLDALSSDRGFHERFAAKMRVSINNDVAAYIDSKRREGHTVLLATASPDFYVPLIWDGDYVATTVVGNPAKIECRGDEKLRRVLEYATTHKCHVDTVITDHYDDAPLFEYNSTGTNILVRPSDRTLRFFRELKPTHFLLIEQVDKLGVSR